MAAGRWPLAAVCGLRAASRRAADCRSLVGQPGRRWPRRATHTHTHPHANTQKPGVPISVVFFDVRRRFSSRPRSARRVLHSLHAVLEGARVELQPGDKEEHNEDDGAHKGAERDIAQALRKLHCKGAKGEGGRAERRGGGPRKGGVKEDRGGKRRTTAEKERVGKERGNCHRQTQLCTTTDRGEGMRGIAIGLRAVVGEAERGREADREGEDARRREEIFYFPFPFLSPPSLPLFPSLSSSSSSLYPKGQRWRLCCCPRR